jgi:DNA-binding NarL/FixJ family response regulator
VVIFSWNTQPDLVERALRKGASGYLSKELTSEEIVGALETVHEGKIVVPHPSRSPAHEAKGDWPGRDVGLTAREAEVLALITQGMSNADIATRTSLSINSIKSYIRSCYRKIGVSSRSQAVLWGATHGFLPDRVRVTDPD